MIEYKNIFAANKSIEKDYSIQTSLEHRKKFAQFFTPYPIADLMAKWLLGNKSLKSVLDPAFGLGIFSRALLTHKTNIDIKGFEIDEYIYSKAEPIFNFIPSLKIHLEDYMYNDWENKYDGIICNPPYFKFHDYDNKAILKEIESKLKVKLTGFSNLYTLFLLKSIYQLEFNGRAAYIIPSEFLNADYGKLVKSYLLNSNTLRHIIIFDFEENIFDDALTTACIILCSNDEQSNNIKFSTICNLSELSQLDNYIDNYPDNFDSENCYKITQLDPNKKWRRYYQEQKSLGFKNLVPFSTFAKVVRGIATGANEYFTFSKAKALEYGIDEKYLMPCICKAADTKGSFFTTDDFKKLKDNNKSIFLFNAVNTNSDSVKKYIKFGEQQGIDRKYLTACRKPWYSLEKRPPAPIWVSVFNRNGLRFIRNEAEISNLTTFHCIYPVKSGLFPSIKTDLLFAYLLTDTAKSIFEDNRREYGNGLQKFEPNDLNKGEILDLSLINKSSEKEILELYNEYRDSVLQSNPDNSFIDRINEIFIEEFSI
ncbi:class I SAM-dependent DNA methyltransferase [Parabacteroides sp. FAFU027]|uniref:HsdM family class I SAM-dependent methyltransferase n=1 Tax=Parabacteroides sp. FAFU027 TaxID=2922715 RepID=UPI001FAFA77A|nr:N-6 DNA methylase [Parabacteroides sp. FAFU027]